MRIENLKEILQNQTSKKNPLTQKELVDRMRMLYTSKTLRKKCFPNYTTRQLRSDIQEIRRHNLMAELWVVSGNFGYYATDDIKDIEAWAKRQYSYIVDYALTLKSLKKRGEIFNYKLDFTE